jgi:hypothetical protein
LLLANAVEESAERITSGIACTVSSSGGQRTSTSFTTFMSYTFTSYTSTYLSYPYILQTPNAIWQNKGETTWMLGDGKLQQNYSSGRGKHNHTYTYIYPTTNDVPQTLK